MNRRSISVLLLSVVAGTGCLSEGAAQVSPSTAPSSATTASESPAVTTATRSEITTPTTARPPTIIFPPKKCIAVTWRPDGGFRCDLPDAVLGFEVGRSNLGPDAGEALGPVCDLLNTRGSPWRVDVIGHTSPEGDTPEGHQRLSDARAEAVKKYLLSCKVAENRVRAYGVGASQPSPAGPHPEGDRRVTIELLPL